MIIPKSLIDHLEHEINIGNVDKKVQNLILIISEENQKLKKQLEIKHDGFMASVEESCELAKENQELKKQQKEFIRWLEKEIVDSKTEGSQRYYTMQHLRLFKEIIGDKE